jgi:hypothetical protein
MEGSLDPWPSQANDKADDCGADTNQCEDSFFRPARPSNMVVDLRLSKHWLCEWGSEEWLDEYDERK